MREQRETLTELGVLRALQATLANDQSYATLLASFQRSADQQFWIGNVDKAPGNLDDGAYLLFIMFVPFMLEHHFSYSGERAVEAGIGAMGVGVVQMLLCWIKMYLDKKTADEMRKKQLRLLQQHARKISTLENNIQISNVESLADLDNKALLDQLMKLKEEKRYYVARMAKRKRKDKIQALINEMQSCEEQESQLSKAFNIAENGADLFTRMNTGIGFMLYGFYYFGTTLDFETKLHALIVGPIIGIVRFIAYKLSQQEFKSEINGGKKEVLPRLEACIQHARQRRRLLKSIQLLQEKNERELKLDLLYEAEYRQVANSVTSYYDTFKLRHDHNKWFERFGKTQYMAFMGMGFGVVPVKLACWFSGAAIGGSAFFIAAPLAGFAMAAIFMVKNYRDLQKIEDQIARKIADLEDYESRHMSEWAHYYGANVIDVMDGHVRSSEKKLVRRLLKRALILDDEEILYTVLEKINKYTDWQVGLATQDAHFYNELAYYLEDGKNSENGNVNQSLAKSLKERLYAGDDNSDPTPTFPGFNTKKWKKIATMVGRVVCVVCPLYVSVYLASAFFTGPLAFFVIPGIAILGTIALIGLIVSMIGQANREAMLSELTTREEKLHLINGCMKVEKQLHQKYHDVAVYVQPKLSYRFAKPTKSCDERRFKPTMADHDISVAELGSGTLLQAM